MTGRPYCIVPAYNALRQLAAVVAGVRDVLPGAFIIVIDDGSDDDTRRVARDVADHTITFDHNRGKGAALRAGFAHALADGAHVLLTIDADGQHDPTFAPMLVAELARADIVIGARARAGAMPLPRRLTNALSTMVVNHLTGCNVADSQSGYRAIRRSVLEQVAPVGDRYEFETDLLIRSRRAGFRIASVRVPTIYGGPSHFRTLHDAARVVRTLWRHRAGA
ncbi:MAG TPA: glycosyltransferase family 2 protein [Gemmatimonadaceae bacterium]|nr:glycosyltransferase family 2 protein [Gemmatimonadaceae bacterium]